MTTRKTKATKLELVGWGATFGYGFITAKTFKKITTKPIDFYDCHEMVEFTDMLGPNCETAQLLVNGKVACANFNGIQQRFTVDLQAPVAVKATTAKKHMVVTYEEEKGCWGEITIDGPFVEEKLSFRVQRLVLPDDFEIDWITASYDGVALDCQDGTDNKNMTAWAIDKDGISHDVNTDDDD